MCPVAHRAQAKPALPEATLPIKPLVYSVEVAPPQIDSTVPVRCLLHKVRVQPAVVVTQVGSCTIKYPVSMAIRCLVECRLPQGRAHTNNTHTERMHSGKKPISNTHTRKSRLNVTSSAAGVGTRDLQSHPFASQGQASKIAVSQANESRLTNEMSQ